MRKIRRDVLIFAAIAVSIPLIILLFIQITPKPPEVEMENARKILSKAETNKANTYSKKSFTEAQAMYDSALVNWKKENKKFLFLRNYDKVKMFAILSTKKATKASENSVVNLQNLKIKLKPKIDSLNDLVRKIDDLFTTYPLSAEVRNRISKGKIILHEAEIIYNKGQYLQANKKVSDCEYLLTGSYENASENLRNYFKSFPVWKNWVDKTLYDSRKNHDYSIIIDKFSRKFYIYFSGSKKYEFDAELGKNWVGDKRIRGDNATPEGMYKVTKKFEGGRTKYYKALLLDYPNAEDKALFRKEIERGTLPASARMGGLIEIHGNGGKGIDWTEGCVALRDSEMDVVYRLVKTGTPVTIIGSMVDLNEVLNK